MNVGGVCCAFYRHSSFVLCAFCFVWRWFSSLFSTHKRSRRLLNHLFFRCAVAVFHDVNALNRSRNKLSIDSISSHNVLFFVVNCGAFDACCVGSLNLTFIRIHNSSIARVINSTQTDKFFFCSVSFLYCAILSNDVS